MKSLLLYGTDTQHMLPNKFDELTIGAAPSNNIVLVSEVVSSTHCKLRRRRRSLRVLDNKSKNGTWYDGVREKSFELQAGKSFVVGGASNRLVALNQQMCALYPELMDILGSQDEHTLQSETPSPSALLVAAINAGHLLITSEPDCRQQRLAEIVHAVSVRRSRPLADISQQRRVVAAPYSELLRAVTGTTTVLDLHRDSHPLPQAMVKALFAGPARTTMMVLAPSTDVAISALGPHFVAHLQQIYVRPVVMRSGAISRLLDREFEKQGSSLRVSLLTMRNQLALAGYSWPQNFASIEQAATYLTAIATAGSVHKAAHDLSMSHSTLNHWYSKQVGMRRGLCSEDFTTK